MSGSAIYKETTNGPIANIIKFFTECIVSDEYAGTVGDYVKEIQTGKTPPMRESKYYESKEINWIKPTDIGKGKYVSNDTDRISIKAVEENKATLYKPNTLLIICIGAGVGRVALTGSSVSSNQQITGILFNEKVLPEYAYYYFFCREDLFKENASKTTLPIINQKGLRALPFKVPEKNVQKSFIEYIAYCERCLNESSVPDTSEFNLPDAIYEFGKKCFNTYYVQYGLANELNNQRSYLQLLRQTILQEAVQGKLTPQVETDEPASELLKRIKAEKQKLIKEGKLKKEKELPPITEEEIPFELPKGWVWCRFGDASISRDGERVPLSAEVRKKRQGVYEYYGAQGVIDKIDSFLFDTSLLLIAEDGGNLLRRSKPVAYFAHGKYWVNNHAHVVDAVDYLTLKYLEVYINSIDLKPYLNGEPPMQIKLNRGKLDIVPVPLPPLSEQKRIVTKVKQLSNYIDQLEQQIAKNQNQAQKLLQAVLKEAFEGKEKEYSSSQELTLAAEA